MAIKVEYDLIPWEDAPSTATPINAENLNKQQAKIKEIIDGLHKLDEAKLGKEEVPNVPVKSVNGKTGAVSLGKTDIGLGNVDNVKQYSASNPPPYPVTSVNGKTGAVTVSVPTKTSQLTNDSNFVTKSVTDALSGQIADQRTDINNLMNQTPTVPVQSVNGKTGAVVLSASDVGATTESWVQTKINDLKAQGIQQIPLFANSIEECTDTTKMYVLPDGFIYAYFYSESTKPNYNNLSETVHENYRMGSGGTLSALNGAVVTDFIPVKKGQTIRFKGFNPLTMPESKYPYICFYTGASESNKVSANVYDRFDYLKAEGGLTQNANGVWEYIAFMATQSAGGSSSGNLSQHKLADSITHVRLSGAMIEGETVVVTVDEEITDSGSTGGYAWRNTGRAFVPTDYEDRIVDLENEVGDVEKEINELKETLKQTDNTTKKWKNKKWVAFGDSLTESNIRTTKNYHGYVADETGISIVNMGYGGSGFKRMFDSNQAYFQRILNVPTDADVVTIMASGNDLSTTWLTYGLGEVTDTGTDTICGCINQTIDNLYSVMPTAQLGIITPTPWDCFYPYATADPQNRMSLYSEAIVEICKRRGIPCLDLYHCSGLRPWVSSFKNLVYSKDDGGGTHPDEKGHSIIAPRIKAFLESLIL